MRKCMGWCEWNLMKLECFGQMYLMKAKNNNLNKIILNFHHVLNVVCFLLGNSPVSEFYMPTFRNTLFHLHGRVGIYPPVKMEQTVCSETLTYKIQTPRNYTEESIQQKLLSLPSWISIEVRYVLCLFTSRVSQSTKTLTFGLNQTIYLQE